MSDPERYLRDNMFYDETVYTPVVRLDDDGFFRWRCTLDKVQDRKMYRFQIKYWAIFALCGLVLGVLLAKVPPDVIRQDPSRYQTVLMQRRTLYGFLGYAAFFAGGILISAIVRLMEGGASTLWYRMNEAFVQVKPSGRSSGITSFAEVKRVEIDPAMNEVRLISRWGKCPVLVRPEDFELVKDHILSHIPENTKIIKF